MARWIPSWLFRKQEDSDLSEELRAHLQIEERQRVEAGEAPADAAREARRAFGNTARIKEDVRETWGWAAFERSLEDLRYGLRMLRKTPAWTQ
jgi:Zn-dependent M32 family carboxypeptidase